METLTGLNRTQTTAAVESYPMTTCVQSSTQVSSRSVSPEATLSWNTLPRHTNNSAQEADRGRAHQDALSSANSGK